MFQFGRRSRAVGEGIGHQPHRRARREDERAPRGVLLEDVVLDRAAELARIGASLFGHDLVHEQEQRGRRVDRHRGRDAVLLDAVEERPHVVERADRHADPSDLALGARIVGVHTELGREIEGDAQAGLAALEQEAVAAVALGRRRETGVLAHRPAAAAVHGWDRCRGCKGRRRDPRARRRPRGDRPA